MFKNLLRKLNPTKTPSMEEEIAQASRKCERTLRDAGFDPREPVQAVEQFIESKRGSEGSSPGAELASDLAAFLGEHARFLVGGKWDEDPLFGLSVVQPGGLAHGVLGPYQIVRKKWQLGDGLSLRNFFKNLQGHLEVNAHRTSTPLANAENAEVADEEFAAATAEQARATLSRDLGTEVPATLVGLRSAERWLREHFLVRTAPIDDFDRVGFLVGEVMRGLYGGEWSLGKARQSGHWADAALVYPELPFFPVGRVLKLLAEQPEGNGLDDYARLVPAARRDLRRDGFNPITGQTL